MILASHLGFAYPASETLMFPDIDVPQGSVVLLSGPSGSGKSTWLALVAGLVPPGTGELIVANQVLGALNRVAADAWRAATIGFLPQRLHLSSALTVAQNLAMAQWAAGHPEDRARIDATLGALGVIELANRKPAQLSSGQAQRVALARAVLLQPKVILADEPTASLDDDAAASAVGLLLVTAKSLGATLVIATHDGRVAPMIPFHADGSAGFTAMKLAPMQALVPV